MALRKITRETVVAHTRDGLSLQGVLIAVHRDSIVLAHALHLSEDGGRTPLDGEVLIPRENLSFVQAGAKASS